MSATRDLIAAALTLADIDEHVAEMPTQAATDVRELCARAMVQPDMGEVKNLVSAACNLMFDAGKLLGRRDAGADREVEDARSARTALLDYVRGVMAERDSLIHDNERLMQIAAQEVSAAGVPMPDAYLYTLEYGETVVNKKVSMQQLNYPFGVCGADYLARNDNGCSYVKQTPLYTTASEAAGYARGKLEAVPSGYWLAPVEPTPEMKSAGLHVEVGENNHVLTWTEVAAIYREMRDASLHGEVKP